MFKENKYSKWYFSIIKKAKSLNRQKGSGIYYENHHVIPKCKPFNGSNGKENLVLLLPREHFLCHWLLVKMCVNKDQEIKMKYAITRMMKNNKITHAHAWSKWQYDINAKIRIKIMKDKHSICQSPMQGKTHSEETKERMRISKLGIKLGKYKDRTKEHSENISKALIGKSNGPRTEETKRKISESQKGKPQNKKMIICSKCGKENYTTQIKRYHNENCKSGVILNGN